MVKQKKVLLGVTGSIAAYKAAEIIRKLMEGGAHVSVIMTKEAEQFITPLTLMSLSGGPVYREMFDYQNGSGKIPHIDLAREADAFLIAPATANVLGKLANGIADDLLTCIALSTKAPILVAPAMNEQMYKNKIVQENCGKLKKYGVQFIGPAEGKLACGATGIGHLADEEEIVKAVLRVIQ